MDKRIFISGLSDSQLVQQMRKAKNLAQMHKILLPVLEPQAVEFNFPYNRKFGASIAKDIYACFSKKNKQGDTQIIYYKTEKEALKVANEIASEIRRYCENYEKAEVELRQRLNTLTERKGALVNQIADAEKTLDNVAHAQANAQISRIDEEIELIVNSL